VLAPLALVRVKFGIVTIVGATGLADITTLVSSFLQLDKRPINPMTVKYMIKFFFIVLKA